MDRMETAATKENGAFLRASAFGRLRSCAQMKSNRMSLRSWSLGLKCAVAISAVNVGIAGAAVPNTYIQPDISAAKIFENNRNYTVEVSILATDFEEMFRRQLSGLGRIDLSGPGLLELEIGRFVARKIKMQSVEGAACQSKVEKAGEDPSNEEGVLVVLTFECATRDVVYDARELLASLGPRAWQVVTIIGDKAASQIMINASGPPVALGKSSG